MKIGLIFQINFLESSFFLQNSSWAAEVEKHSFERDFKRTSSFFDGCFLKEICGADPQNISRAAEAEKIRANADRQRVGLLAQAYKEAQDIKGIGDAKAASAYADAFGEDPEFAEFYRSLKAYRESFKSGSDLIITDPNSDFFQFFKSNKGGN